MDVERLGTRFSEMERRHLWTQQEQPTQPTWRAQPPSGQVSAHPLPPPGAASAGHLVSSSGPSFKAGASSMESLPLSLQENCSPWLGFPLPAAWFPCGHLNGQGGLGVRGQRRWGLGTPFHRGLRRVGAGLWWVPRWAGCSRGLGRQLTPRRGRGLSGQFPPLTPRPQATDRKSVV